MTQLVIHSFINISHVNVPHAEDLRRDVPSLRSSLETGEPVNRVCWRCSDRGRLWARGEAPESAEFRLVREE